MLTATLDYHAVSSAGKGVMSPPVAVAGIGMVLGAAD
jgi:hypothetical protein